MRGTAEPLAWAKRSGHALAIFAFLGWSDGHLVDHAFHASDGMHGTDDRFALILLSQGAVSVTVPLMTSMATLLPEPLQRWASF